jgi:hypothetical protein
VVITTLGNGLAITIGWLIALLVLILAMSVAARKRAP